MKDANLYYQEGDNHFVDKDNIILYDFDETTNTCLVIAEGTWYEDGKDKDVPEIDKVVELTKIISLKTPGFLNIIT